jgi:hypothetical protein
MGVLFWISSNNIGKTQTQIPKIKSQISKGTLQKLIMGYLAAQRLVLKYEIVYSPFRGWGYKKALTEPSGLI